jgi:hypothetical protein
MPEPQIPQPIELPDRQRDRAWKFWPIVPLYPYGQRRTLRVEVVKDTIWTFEQVQGILYVVVPIRMTVVKLEAGGLLVYAPVAPTPECLRLLNELVQAHGDVKYIILPTISGLEHKVFVGPFARYFPQAQVFVASHQWSYPINLPLSWLGFPPGRTQVLPENSGDAPFSKEFDYATLGPIHLGLGAFGEVAFLHRSSQTLLVTDSVVSISDRPPTIAQLDPYPLLFHARDSAGDRIEDNEANRCKGWLRTVLFALYFRPSVLETLGFGEVVRSAFQASERSRQAYFGLFPFKWQENWQSSFELLRVQGNPFVAPILQVLILNRAPKRTIIWADRLATWDFKQIIACHFDAPVTVEPCQFRQAFNFLEKDPVTHTPAKSEEDLAFLKEIEISLNKRGITLPAKSLVRSDLDG